jgi:hypothetical protein
VHSEAIFLLALLFVPGLLALLLLMEWLEHVLTRNMVVDEILLVLTQSSAPDEVEAAAAQRLARVLRDS